MRSLGSVGPQHVLLVGELLQGVDETGEARHRQEGDQRARVSVDQDDGEGPPHSVQHPHRLRVAGAGAWEG